MRKPEELPYFAITTEFLSKEGEQHHFNKGVTNRNLGINFNGPALIGIAPTHTIKNLV